MLKKNAKTIGLVLIILVAVVTIVWVAPRETNAGGGINHKVTVINDSGSKCKVNLSKDKLVNEDWVGVVTISAGDSYTFETGSLCPCCLKGQYYDAANNVWRKLLTKNVGLGNDSKNCDCTAACWDSTWRICRKAGEGYTQVRDYDFGFCR